MTNVWSPAENVLLGQNIDEVSTTAKATLGTIVKMKHATYGAAEFIYLKGVASNFVGALVTYVANTGVTVLSTTSGIVAGGAPMAVSMSAAVAAEYMWAMIGGDALMYKTAVKFDPSLGQRVYLSATAGRVMQTSVAGRQIIGARFAATATVTATTSTVIVTLNRPAQKTGTAV